MCSNTTNRITKIQCGLYQSTIDRIEFINKFRNLNNKTQAISESISMYHAICKELSIGNIVEVNVYDRDGNTYIIPMPNSCKK